MAPHDMRRPRSNSNRGNYEKSMCNFTIKPVGTYQVLMKLV